MKKEYIIKWKTIEVENACRTLDDLEAMIYIRTFSMGILTFDRNCIVLSDESATLLMLKHGDSLSLTSTAEFKKHLTM